MGKRGATPSFGLLGLDEDRFRPEMRARAPGGGRTPPPLGGAGLRGAGIWRSRDRMRAVVAKVRYRNGMRGAVKHAQYVGKEGKGEDKDRPVFFTRDADGIDGVAEVRRWVAEGDRRWWKLTISPEDRLTGGRGAYLEMVRHTMAEAEVDLGTSLEWVAGVHYDGGKVHVHVIVRGKDDLGEDLAIHPDYIKRGFRTHAREFVTYDDRHGLGERSDAEIERARARSLEIRERRREGRELLDEALESGAVGEKEARRLGKLVDKGSAEQIETAVSRIGERLEQRAAERARGLQRDDVPMRGRRPSSMDIGF